MNKEQIEYWNADAGRGWAKMQARMDHALTPVTAALFDLARPLPGERAMDIGCGTGETSLALAAAVGEDGAVLGVDISRPMLDVAEARAESLESHAEFQEADAAALPGAADHDLVISRFGVMFFDDPVFALGNIRQHVKIGGRFCFVCWQAPDENGWATLSTAAVAELLPPSPPADPLAPGPFAFAEGSRLEAILEEAGWSDISLVPQDFLMAIGRGEDPIADAVDFSVKIGPAARAIRDGGADVAAKAKAKLAEIYADHLHDGAVALPASIWLVSARRIE